MSERVAPAPAPARQPAAPQPVSRSGVRLQRKCACGRHTVGGGECAECARKRTTLQRWPATRPLSAAMLRGADAERPGAVDDHDPQGRDFIRLDVRDAASGKRPGSDVRWMTSTLADTVAGSGARGSAFGRRGSVGGGPSRLRDTYPAATRGPAPAAESTARDDLSEAVHPEPASADSTPAIPASAAASPSQSTTTTTTTTTAAVDTGSAAVPASTPAIAPASAAPRTPIARPTQGVDPAEQREGMEEPRGEEEGAPAATTRRPLLLDDDGEAPGPGQMRRGEFLVRLQAEVTRAAEDALAGTGRTTEGCPYLRFWFGYYSRRGSAEVERALHRYAPGAARARRADDYIPLVVDRVRRAVAAWARTGEVTGVPSGLSAHAARPARRPAVAGGGPVFGAVQLKARPGGGRAGEDPETIQAQLGDGRPLDGGVRARMEGALGQGLGSVRLHTGATADRLAGGLNARAFAVGRHVAFAAGQYRPGTPMGDALIAHELAHVVQQQGGAGTVAPLEAAGARYDGLEGDADRAAAGVVASLWGGAREAAGRAAHNAVPALRSGLRLQRCGSGTNNGTFSEHPSERFHGFDPTINPRGLVVPVGQTRKVKVSTKEGLLFTASPPGNVVRIDSTTPADGITVTGVSHGHATIRARQGTETRDQLAVSSKRPKPIRVDYHYVSDNAGHSTTHAPGHEAALTTGLNTVWEKQANVRFTTGTVDSPVVAQDLGDIVTGANDQAPEWRAVTAKATGGDYNVFFVWEFELSGTTPDATADGGTAGSNTLLDDEGCSDGFTLAHEAGHFLGLHGHATESIMSTCANQDDRRRVLKSDADTANP